MGKCHAKYLLNTRGILVIRGAIFYFDDIKRVTIVPFFTKETISFGPHLFSERDDGYIESLVEIKNRVYVRYDKMYGFNKE